MNKKEGIPQKVLFVRLSAIGDVVHTLPCARLLKETFPEIEIGWLVEETPSFLVEMNSYVDRTHIYPRRKLRKAGKDVIKQTRHFLRSLREEQYELAIDFQGLTKSSMIPFLSRIPRRIGFAGKEGREISFLFNKERVKAEGKHVILKNCSLLQPILGREIKEEDIPLPYVFLHSEQKREVQEKYASYLKSSPVIVNPGGGWVTKIWPSTYYRKLIRLLSEEGLTVCISWGPEEKGMAEDIYAPFKENKRVSLLPLTTLFELSAILEKASVVIGPDTGPVHIAAGLNRPVVSIFGASESQRNAPWSSSSVTLQKYFSCGPCWNKRNCKYDLKCMAAIEPEDVYDAALRLLR